MSTFANSEDPDEMQHNAAFHQGLHCFKGINNLQTKEYYILNNYNLIPLDMYNGLSQVYCFKPDEGIHKYTRVVQKVPMSHCISII